MGRSLLLSF